MAKHEKLTTASVLSFERKLDPSDGLFYSGRWDQREEAGAWLPVRLREKSVRGTISNRLKTKDQDPAKLDAAIENPNLQTVDVATLPNDADTLRLQFTLRVLSGAGTPSACNQAAYREKLLSVVEQYRQNGFAELARRYAYNLVNGRFLWRNRIGAEQVEVRVNHRVRGQIVNSWTFDALEHRLDRVEPEADATSGFGMLAKLIEDGLSGQTGHTLLEVIAHARVGDGQEVFPSQELILDKGDKKGQKSRTLYSVGLGENAVAAMHSQKIGNALRTIDTWYPNVEHDHSGPIAVEPYGSVTTQARAYRQPKVHADFYSLLDAWVLRDKTPEIGNQHFVMATLIRGGVFGDSGSD